MRAMTDPSENDCEACADDYSFQCEDCHYCFCDEHAQKHTVEECERYQEDMRRD